MATAKAKTVSKKGKTVSKPVRRTTTAASIIEAANREELNKEESYIPNGVLDFNFSSEEESVRALGGSIIAASKQQEAAEQRFGIMVGVYVESGGDKEKFLKRVDQAKARFMDDYGAGCVGLFVKPKTMSSSEWDAVVTQFRAGTLTSAEINKHLGTRPDKIMSFIEDDSDLSTGDRTFLKHLGTYVKYDSTNKTLLLDKDETYSKDGSRMLLDNVVSPYAAVVVPRRKGEGWSNSTLFFPPPFQVAVSRICNAHDAVGSDKLLGSVMAGEGSSSDLDKIIKAHKAANKTIQSAMQKAEHGMSMVRSNWPVLSNQEKALIIEKIDAMLGVKK